MGKESNMLVVNLFGAPGAGKSTGAAYIFSQLKMKGINVELVTEFAKDKVWEDNKEVFKNQAYIFGKQSFKMSRCKDKVDVLITDSPLFLSALYNADEVLGEDFNKVVLNVFNSYDNINFFIKRNKPYNPVGRNQTEAESDALSLDLRLKLEKNGIEYLSMYGDYESYNEAVGIILEKVKKNEQKV
jgi:hypothetical protein